MKNPSIHRATFIAGEEDDASRQSSRRRLSVRPVILHFLQPFFRKSYSRSSTKNEVYVLRIVGTAPYRFGPVLVCKKDTETTLKG